MFLAIFTGLSRIFNHISYTHYVVHSTWLKFSKKQKESEHSLVRQYPQIFSNPEDIDLDQIEKDIATYDNQHKKDFKKTKFTL